MNNTTNTKVPLAKLYKKTSARTGVPYFVGRLGLSRVLLFRDRDQAEGEDEIWNLLVEPVDEQPKTTAAPSRKPRLPRDDRMDSMIKDVIGAD
jgi:hypothetical protein